MQPPSRVLVVHNRYQQRGGEDAVVEAEVALLRGGGHEVAMYARDNAELATIPSASAAFATIWSARTSREIDACVRGFRPDVVHVHNTFPLISPSLFWQVHRARIPLVQTLHNFRLMCPQAMLLRRGRICEDCVGGIPWRGVLRRCYRGSASQSAVVTSMLALHRLAGTWESKVTLFIALNEFCRQKFVSGGLPATKLVVKPHFVAWERSSNPHRSPVRSDAPFLFVGRLAEEKGVITLASALRSAPEIAVRIAGTGPAAGALHPFDRATLLGELTAARVQREMEGALALVMPSICYETFGLVLIEAFACGLPVIASRLGATAEIVRDQETGLLFEPGDVADLTAKLRWAHSNREAMRRMGANARREYEAKYTPEINYRQLVAIYGDAIREVRSGPD